MRKRLLVLVTVLVVLAALPLAAFAQTAEGTGHIVAEGDGLAYLRGEGWVRITGNGTLLIRDRAGDAEIVVTGNGSRVQRGQTIYYRGFDGEAYVRGSAITVGLRGHDIHLEAEGTGVVYLRGEGWYNVNGEEGRWTASGVRLQLRPVGDPASAN